MTDLESVVEDGQMILRKKRPLWWTPTRTAALALLDEIRNFEKSKQGCHSFDTGREENSSLQRS